MNVLMTVASINPEYGGPAKSVTELSNGLVSKNASVLLFTMGKVDNLIIDSEDEILYKLSLHHKGTSIISGFRSIRHIAQEMKRKLCGGNDNIIHNHGIWLWVNHMASSVARNTGTPLVVSPRGMLEPWSMDYKKTKKNAAWRLYQKRDLDTANVLHATAVQEAENLRRLGFKQPIAVIPNGVDQPLLKMDVKTRDTRRTVLFLSRIHPKKGLINLVEAWSRVRPKGWRVRIAGPDENGHQKEVIERIKRTSTSDQFEFLGPVYNRNKWDLYAKADLFVLPSYSENFGIVVAEALAAGVPVITTKATPWEDLIKNDCGWWVEVGVEPLADALKSAITLADNKRKEMGLRGRELIQRSYSWSKIATSMLEVYYWILGGGPTPSCVMTD